MSLNRSIIRPSRNSEVEYISTILDTGRGLAHTSDYLPRRSGEVPLSYSGIKSQCLAGRILWEDPDFRPVASSVFFNQQPSMWPNIQWKRPHEICANPQFFVDGANRMDVVQGELKDCWMLAAVASLTANQNLLYQVVPPDQSFAKDYAGIFRFSFWQYGRWVDVLIDDYLPVHNGSLIYLQSMSRNEFWSSLLEKAYAKLNGSYEALAYGNASESLTDFTGGLVEGYQLKANNEPELFKLMFKAFKRGSLLCCTIFTGSGRETEKGLAQYHCYSVTDVRTIQGVTRTISGEIQMVRIRNPWGDKGIEWKGAWSDGSPEWNSVPAEKKLSMGLKFDHDGEFWMSFTDFKINFELLEICYLGPDSLEVQKTQRMETKWDEQLFEGSWRRGKNAGGCQNHPDTFWANPNYKVKIVDPDSDDEDGNGTVIIGLMQKERRKLKREGKGYLSIGYSVYKIPSTQHSVLNRDFFNTHRTAANSFGYLETRERTSHHKLPPGVYVVVPTTFKPNEEGDFILRVFSERKNEETEELDLITCATCFAALRNWCNR